VQKKRKKAVERKKDLTPPALLEMDDYCVNRPGGLFLSVPSPVRRIGALVDIPLIPRLIFSHRLRGARLSRVARCA